MIKQSSQISFLNVNNSLTISSKCFKNSDEYKRENPQKMRKNVAFYTEYVKMLRAF